MNLIILFPLVIFLTLFVIESFIAATWFRPYFRYGIKVYQRFYPGVTPKELDILIGRASNEIERSIFATIVFELFTPTEWAFRERLIDFKLLIYPAVMRGTIQLDESQNMLVVTGYLNWYIPIFIVSFGVYYLSTQSSSYSNFPLTLLFLAVAVGIYFLQVYRYNRIGQIVSKQT